MSLSTAQQQKAKIIDDIREKINRSRGLIFFEYHGLNVEEVNTLRSKVREGNGEFKVYKNTLLKRALEGHPLKDELAGDLKGPMACVFSYGDIVPSAKVLSKFQNRKEEDLKLKSGVLISKKISSDEIKQIAKLPGREELLAKLVGTLAAPLQAFVTVLSAVPRDFVYALKAIQTKKEKS
ncbi:MAG: 50S ribosomal protein L10 [Deltaproteobacteria bacterium RIFCSPHIGHO2_02_FULL_40_11]|nr:MAG: 50S ribosomal protein L10 [Deltaproteobacteria bacterium RIFCSPHIGHO2_02_FULL_40_11]